MAILLKVFSIYVLFSIANCNPIADLFIPCVRGDLACLKVSSQLVYQKLVVGIPSLGIKTADPVKHKELSGSYKKFTYYFRDVTLRGLKNCIVNSINLDLDIIILEVELLCVNSTFSGKYDVYGEFAGKKIEDSSTFVTQTYTYLSGITAEIKQVLGNDRKKHLKLVNIVTNFSPLGRIKVTLEDNDDLEKDIYLHWKENSKIVEQSFIDSGIRDLVDRANQFLMKIPVDDLFNNDKDLTSDVIFNREIINEFEE